jgi:hypothetical protein
VNPFSPPSAQRPSFFPPAFVALLFICIAALLMIADRAPLHLDRRNPSPPVISDFYRHYDSVLDGSIGSPYAYRLLVPWITAFAHRLFPSVTEIDIDAVLKVLILFCVQITFFWTQRRFYAPWIALAGVFWMDVLIGYSLAYVLGPASGETTDLLNLLVFVLALDLMLDGKTAALALLFVVGMLNRETPLLLLPLIYALDRSARRRAARSVIVTLASVAVYVGLRLAVQTTGGKWFTMQGLGSNIPGYEPGMGGRALQSALHVLVLLVPLFGLAVAGFNRKQILFRGSIVLAGILVIVHFVVATVIESRLWMPVFALLIPPSLLTLQGIFNRRPES